MRNLSLFRPTLLVAIGAALTMGTALAQDTTSASSAIKARQANYKRMGAALKTIKDELAQANPSRDAVLAASQTLSATAKLQVKLFPAGSGPSSGVKTDALASIWTNRAAFNASMQELISESGKLVVVAQKGDKAAMTAQYRETGKTCGACHRQFRADD